MGDTGNQTLYDVILVGGGLANALIAWRLVQRRPEVKFLLLEASPSLFGPALKRTWSFHSSDIAGASASTGDVDLSWVSELSTYRWPGYNVAFPNLTRGFESGYQSTNSEDLSRRLGNVLAARARFNARVLGVKAHCVHLESGEVIAANLVIDGRGFGPHVPYACGYQKFVGLNLRLSGPHGIMRPLLMDACVEQLDGYRFVYLLPWSRTEILVEDTYYSNTKDLDLGVIESRINAYVCRRGWQIADVMGKESGVLPIPLAGAKPPKFARGVASSGVAAGRFHPTTGYSLGAAARLASQVADLPAFNGEAAEQLNGESARLWNRGQFLRQLNNMMFLAARPGERWRVMETFYRRDVELIARFYRGSLGPFDRLKLLSGKPPVAIGPALKAFVTRVNHEGSSLA